jgi:hypothetical protein
VDFGRRTGYRVRSAAIFLSAGPAECSAVGWLPIVACRLLLPGPQTTGSIARIAWGERGRRSEQLSEASASAAGRRAIDNLT